MPKHSSPKTADSDCWSALCSCHARWPAWRRQCGRQELAADGPHSGGRQARLRLPCWLNPLLLLLLLCHRRRPLLLLLLLLLLRCRTILLLLRRRSILLLGRRRRQRVRLRLRLCLELRLRLRRGPRRGVEALPQVRLCADDRPPQQL